MLTHSRRRVIGRRLNVGSGSGLEDGRGGCGDGSDDGGLGHDGVDGRDLNGHGIGRTVQFDEHADEDRQCEDEDERRRDERDYPPIEPGRGAVDEDEVGDIVGGVDDVPALDPELGVELRQRRELAGRGDVVDIESCRDAVGDTRGDGDLFGETGGVVAARREGDAHDAGGGEHLVLTGESRDVLIDDVPIVAVGRHRGVGEHVVGGDGVREGHGGVGDAVLDEGDLADHDPDGARSVAADGVVGIGAADGVGVGAGGLGRRADDLSAAVAVSDGEVLKARGIEDYAGVIRIGRSDVVGLGGVLHSDGDPNGLQACDQHGGADQAREHASG